MATNLTTDHLRGKRRREEILGESGETAWRRTGELAPERHVLARAALRFLEEAIVVLALLAVALNWIKTGDHLARSLAHRHLWPIAGMYLLLLVGAVTAGITAHRLHGRLQC